MNGRLVLVFNAGSSSLKYEVFEAASDGLRSVVAGAVRGVGRSASVHEHGGRVETIRGVANTRRAAELALTKLFDGAEPPLARERVAASGHRVVHGGDDFSRPIRITVSAFDRLRALGTLAPLHNPPALAVMEAIDVAFPELPMVAVFDTAFFHDLPDAARHYALPKSWTERHRIRRYGFHGLAHEHLARSLREAGAGPRAVTLHLGQGCSAAALLDGRPLDTSMGFTPLEGLVMGTRPGDVDPGVLAYLARLGVEPRELDEVLNRRSGLLGLSGSSDDVRELLALEANGNAGAKLALDVFCLRVRKYLGAYAAVLGGLDAIAIGGGIGENSPEIRARSLGSLGWLGVEIDPHANEACRGAPARISAAGSRVDVHVTPVDEEPIIARAVLEVLDP